MSEPRASDKAQRSYARERAFVAIAEAVTRALADAGLDDSEVAERLDWDADRVPKLLANGNEMTLRELADILWASGLEVMDLEVRPISELPAPAVRKRAGERKVGEAPASSGDDTVSAVVAWLAVSTLRLDELERRIAFVPDEVARRIEVRRRRADVLVSGPRDDMLLFGRALQLESYRRYLGPRVVGACRVVGDAILRSGIASMATGKRSARR